jgi:hypothetical protein
MYLPFTLATGSSFLINNLKSVEIAEYASFKCTLYNFTILFIVNKRQDLSMHVRTCVCVCVCVCEREREREREKLISKLQHIRKTSSGKNKSLMGTFKVITPTV